MLAIKTTLAYPNLYLVHKKGKPLVWPVEEERHAVVSFSKPETALTIASYTESHYLTHKEWPDSLSFSFKKQVIPTILGVHRVDFSTLSERCSLWNLKLIIIDDISKNKFSGDIRDFETDRDALVTHLNTLLWDPGS